MKIVLGLLLAFLLVQSAQADERVSLLPQGFKITDLTVTNDPVIVSYTLEGTGARSGCVVRRDYLYSFGWHNRGPLLVLNRWWVHTKDGSIITAEQFVPSFMWHVLAPPMAHGDFETLKSLCGFESAA